MLPTAAIADVQGQAHHWVRDAVHDLVPVLVLTRLFFLGVTFAIPLWRALVGTPPLRLAVATGTPLDEWNRWDTRWYSDLAQLGYNLRGPDDYKNVAFFPLYPLLTRTLHDLLAIAMGVIPGFIVRPGDPPYLIPGLIVANLCTVVALVYLYCLVRLDYGRAVARRAAILFTLSPMALYLFAAYSEGPFLLCTIACLYTLRRQRWWPAGLWGLLAAIARPPGMILLIPFMMAWVEAHPVAAGSLAARLRRAGAQLRLAWRTRLPRSWFRTVPHRAHRQNPSAPLSLSATRPTLERGSDRLTPRRRALDLRAHAERAPRHMVARMQTTWTDEVRPALLNACPVVIIPLGLVLFMAFLYVAFGDPLWFSRAQHAWLRTFAPPWVTLYYAVVYPLGDVIQGVYNTSDASGLHDLIYAIAGLALTALTLRRLPTSQRVYVVLLWGVLLTSPAMLTEGRTGQPHHDVLMSLPRMLLMLFPLWSYLGLQPHLYRWLIGLFSLSLAIYTVMFLTGGWIA